MIEALVDQIQQELNMVLISQTDVVKRHHMDRATRQMKDLRDIVWKREPFDTQKAQDSYGYVID